MTIKIVCRCGGAFSAAIGHTSFEKDEYKKFMEAHESCQPKKESNQGKDFIAETAQAKKTDGMTAEKVIEAGALIDELEILKKFIEQPSCQVISNRDWSFGCEVLPTRLQMVRANELAERAAKAILIGAAEQMVESIKKYLKEMGVEIQP